MPTKAYLTVEDYDGEKSSVGWWVQDIGNANYGSVTTDIDEMSDAIRTMIRGRRLEVGFTKTFIETDGPVTNAEAQRETKWLVVYKDTTQFLDVGNTIANTGFGKVFNLELPTALLTGLLDTNSNKADLTDPVVAAFVTTFEANVRSPYNHTAAVTPTIEVLEILHVGRSV